MERELRIVQHRPFPLRNNAWIMKQTWEDVVFFHFPVPPETLQECLPSGLEIDTFEGSAWIGIVAFTVTDMRVRFCPPIPGLKEFNQINVRTYVRCGTRTGAYFFSLDATSPVAAFIARKTFSIPYKKADIYKGRDGDLFHMIESRPNEKKQEAYCRLEYTPCRETITFSKIKLEGWLTERYCLWTKLRGKLYRVDIHHTRWKLVKAEGTIIQQNMAPFLPSKYMEQVPVVHFSPRKKAFIWCLDREKGHEGIF
ncbi:YqjF family protein [Bacillus massilinigeriensis]|uniref:YqjF family protein n=1 Tax=Bacillus mediterraneensis TaxID=1805474 RepID=UPI0008F9493C|nr:DUF2071 domain-containing protein [Bacillus mediterraneensis]